MLNHTGNNKQCIYKPLTKNAHRVEAGNLKSVMDVRVLCHYYAAITILIQPMFKAEIQFFNEMRKLRSTTWVQNSARHNQYIVFEEAGRLVMAGAIKVRH